MGGDFTRLRFSEKEIKVDTQDAISFMKSVVSLAVFAPFHLINEVSLRIMFLSKPLISKVLFTAILLDAAITVAIGVLRLLSGSFSLLHGELPFIALVLSCFVLVLIYLLFQTVSLTLYDELKHMFPRDVEGASRSAKIMQTVNRENTVAEVDDDFTETGDDTVAASSVGCLHHLDRESIAGSGQPGCAKSGDTQLQESSSMTDLDELAGQLQALAGKTLGVEQQMQNKDGDFVQAIAIGSAQRATEFFSSNVVNSVSLKDYKLGMQNKVQDLREHPFKSEGFTGEDLQHLHSAMDSAAGSMQFINAQFIDEFANEQIDMDMAFIDGLNISVIPDTFTMLA